LFFWSLGLKNRVAHLHRRAPGAARTALIVTGLSALSGCFAPVAQREAQNIAQQRVDRYCAGRCGALTLAHTQKIKSRWLVDFDGPRQKFTVTVEGDGNAKVEVWDKSLSPVATP
jgi:hypothetical protein